MVGIWRGQRARARHAVRPPKAPARGPRGDFSRSPSTPPGPPATGHGWPGEHGRCLAVCQITDRGACVISPGMSGLCSPEAETASSWSTWTGRPRSGVRVVIGRCACLLTAGFCRGKASICEGLDTRVSTPAWRFGHIEVTPSSRLSRFPCIADVCTECCGYVH